MQFAALQDIADGNAARWGDDVVLLSVNKSGYEDGIADIMANYPDAVLPILQDDSKIQAFFNCGADKNYFYVLDGDRNIRFAHYLLTVEDEDGEQLRLIDEIDQVLGR